MRTARLTDAQRDLAGAWYAATLARSRRDYGRAYRALDGDAFTSAVHMGLVKAAGRFRPGAGGIDLARYALYQVRGELREAVRHARPRGFRRSADAAPLDLPLTGDVLSQ